MGDRVVLNYPAEVDGRLATVKEVPRYDAEALYTVVLDDPPHNGYTPTWPAKASEMDFAAGAAEALLPIGTRVCILNDGLRRDVRPIGTIVYNDGQHGAWTYGITRDDGLRGGGREGTWGAMRKDVEARYPLASRADTVAREATAATETTREGVKGMTDYTVGDGDTQAFSFPNSSGYQTVGVEAFAIEYVRGPELGPNDRPTQKFKRLSTEEYGVEFQPGQVRVTFVAAPEKDSALVRVGGGAY